VQNGEVWLHNVHIPPYGPATRENHEPERPRKLLMHRREIERLIGKTKEKGLTLVPTRLYFSDSNRAKVEIVWVASDDAQTASGAASVLSQVDGVLIPGGFGIRGIEGKVGAIEYARTRGVPLLGLCLGLQCMVIEAARNLAGITDAGSSEFDENTTHPVISTMADQRDVVAGERDMGGTMRLGAYPAKLKAGSQVAKAYGTTEVSERHRHRYEVNNAYRKQLSDAGLVFSGTSPDDRLVEFVELPADKHPFFVGTQAHPELKSRPTRPHPLFSAFVKAVVDRKVAERLPVELPEAPVAAR